MTTLDNGTKVPVTVSEKGVDLANRLLQGEIDKLGGRDTKKGILSDMGIIKSQLELITKSREQDARATSYNATKVFSDIANLTYASSLRDFAKAQGVELPPVEESMPHYFSDTDKGNLAKNSIQSKGDTTVAGNLKNANLTIPPDSDNPDPGQVVRTKFNPSETKPSVVKP